MNRKVISLLAILAMLCTMFTFEMPAIAEETASEDTALSSILADIDVGGTELKKLSADADDETIIAAAQLDKDGITWKPFNWKNAPYPRYAYHKVYEAAGYTDDKWSLSFQEDWEAMREVADSVNATLGSEGADALTDENGAYVDYFVDTEFHLTNDINFEYEEYYAYAEENQATSYHGEDIKAMGFSIYSEGGGFAGTINGHGYSFKNVVIQALKAWLSDADGNAYKNYDLCAGLFHRLADCKFIDFGLEGGIIYQNSGNASSCVSTFGNVIPGKTPSFERVWSSVTLAPICNAQATALVGSFADQAITVDVNGYVFDGEILKGSSTDHSQQLSYAVYSSGGDFFANNNDFYNIITDFSSRNGSYSKSAEISYKNDDLGTAALFAFTSEEAYKEATIKNVYAVKRAENGIDDGYAINNTLGGSHSASLLTDMSAAEAAWTINNNPTENPVFFKLNDEGKVRPIPEGKSDGMIVGITVEIEDTTKNVCVNPESTVDLKAALGYTSDVSFEVVKGDCTINDGTTEVTVGTGDVTVKMTNPCKDHAFEYTYTEGDKKHTAICSICNHQVTEDCELTNCTKNDLDWNAYTHTGTCVCGNGFAEVCDYVYTKTEGGYKYICSCGREEDAPAPMVAGDVKGDGKVDLTDAIALLKKLVKTVNNTINERNADVDGDNSAPDIGDVHKIILFFLKDKKTVDAFEAIEQRVNEANFYNEKNINFGNLKMDGSDGTNLRYVRTDYISVSEGNKIVFGPVRKAQAVLGHFYDADGNAIELININNERLETKYSFKAEIQEKDVEIQADGSVVGELETKEVDGLAMVSITAPEGAAYVRLQANAKEENQFYIRINNEFSLADYHCRTNGDADALTNIEKDQMFLVVGDSLCSAAVDTEGKGWRGRLVRDLGVVTSYSAQGGSALSTIRFLKANDDANLDTEGSDVNPRQCIVNQINEWRDSGRQFEYILLEGGGNDGSQDAEVGYYVDDDPTKGMQFNPTSYDPKDFAPESTYVGGLERAIYSAIKTYGDTAAIGYMSIYNGPYYGSGKFADLSKYFQYAKEICDKWGVPYLDLNTSSEFNAEFNPKITNEAKVQAYIDSDDYEYQYTLEQAYDANAHTVDGIHANATGYDVMQKYIGPFFANEMRPADQEIFLEIQQYEDIDKVIGMN